MNTSDSGRSHSSWQFLIRFAGASYANNCGDAVPKGRNCADLPTTCKRVARGDSDGAANSKMPMLAPVDEKYFSLAMFWPVTLIVISWP